MCEVSQEWANTFLALSFLFLAGSLFWAAQRMTMRRVEARRIAEHEAEIEFLNLRVPKKTGYTHVPQYVSTMRRDRRGHLVLGKVVTHYLYFLDGKRIPAPFDTKE